MAVLKTRYGGARHLITLLPPLINPALKRRGFQSGALFMDWPIIVGPDMARLCRPEKLTFPKDRRDQGTLTLVAYDGSAALFLQHALDLILNHINMHFGYKAVGRIRIIQRPDETHGWGGKGGGSKAQKQPTMMHTDIEPFEQRYPLPTDPVSDTPQGGNTAPSKTLDPKKLALENSLKSLYEHWAMDGKRHMQR